MGFFENTRKPQGFGGKIMVKMMNIGHSKLAKWGFTKIYAKSNAKVLDIGCGGGANIVNWLGKCSTGHVTGIDYSKVSVEESKKLNAVAIDQEKFAAFSFIRQEKCLTLLDNSVIITMLLKIKEFRQ